MERCLAEVMLTLPLEPELSILRPEFLDILSCATDLER